MKRQMKSKIVLLAVICLLGSCHERYVPKPRGYFRIAIPDTAYAPCSLAGYPYAFSLSQNASVQPHPEAGEQYWIDLCYPRFDVRVHCSYKPVRGNLRELSDDAQEFVYKHAGKATSIPEQGFENPEQRVWGVYYELQGNTASPFQFYLTDSVHHFFRGAVYFNCIPEQDSLQPVIDYLRLDIRQLIESFTWQE